MGLVGRWRLVEMDLWDLDAMELIGPACIDLTSDGMGHVRFIAVEGTLDWRDAERDSRPGMEFTWNGSDDGDPARGRGWAVLESDGALRGHIYFHLGDDSGSRAVPEDTAARRSHARG